MDGKSRTAVKTSALIGLLAASITAAKLALMEIPNIEAVTLLIIMYTAVFGLGISVPATIVFVSVEILLFGLNTWVVSYYIHWCALCLVTAAVVRIFGANRWALAGLAFVMSACFGVLTTLVDTLFVSNTADIVFGKYFAALYARGIVFFIVHTVSNTAVLFAFAEPLGRLLSRLKAQYFASASKNV